MIYLAFFFTEKLVSHFYLYLRHQPPDLSTREQGPPSNAMTFTNSQPVKLTQAPADKESKDLEKWDTLPGNLVYDEVDEEPELHARTYGAMAALLMLNLVILFALQGPPSFVSHLLDVRGAQFADVAWYSFPTSERTWMLPRLSLGYPMHLCLCRQWWGRSCRSPQIRFRPVNLY